MSEPNRYSIWVAPKGETGNALQQLIEDLAAEYDAPEFVPHMTLVADIYPNESEVAALRERIASLAAKLTPFDITLTGYGYKDETFRCLYLLADAPELPALYNEVKELFPQVATEHFVTMPHISVLYGNLDEATKNGIIQAHPITPLTFAVNSIDLYRTNNPVESWQRIGTFPLGD